MQFRGVHAMRTATALAALALTVAASAQAQQQGQQARANRTQAAQATEPTLSLTANARGVRSDRTTSRSLQIEVLDLQVRIRGGVAETRVTATFANPTDEVMEGDFRFDMPAGSVVTGYALDIGQQMIDGVIAGRDQAREAYQRRVVQRIDPGLAEVTWADRFSTRIFPIPARGSRTIRLVMTSPLDPARGYELPLRTDAPVGRLTLAIESDDGNPPQVVLPGTLRAAFTNGRLSVDQWNVRVNGELRLAAPAAAALTVSRHANGQSFFDLSVPVADATAETRDRPVHIFWDRSISRADDNLAGERALIAALLSTPGVRVSELTLFDSGGAQTSRPADAAALDAALAAVRYGGGSSFAGLPSEGVEPGAICLLVSDGRATLDGRAGFALPCRTFAIASDREIDRGWLSQIADRSGGSLIELGSLSTTEAVRRILARGATAGTVTDDQGHAIDTIMLPAGDGRVRLIGPMPDSGGLRLTRAGTEAQTFARPGVTPPLYSGPGALWAARRIAADSSDLSTSALVEMSRRYSVASPLASFIVLEQPADYVEANIPPPANYPKALNDQYLALRASADQQISAQQEARLGQVAALWADQRSWWGRDFAKEAIDAQRQRDEQSRSSSRDQRQQTRSGGQRPSGNAVPPPSPPPPPPPPPPVLASPPPPPVMAAPVTDGTAEIVVSAQRRTETMDSVSPVTVVGAEDADAGQNIVVTGTVMEPSANAASPQPTAGISTPDWSPGRPWITAIDAAGAEWADEIDRQRASHGALPLFWFDLAEWHWRAGRQAEARRAVESALDLPARDNQTLEIVAGRLARYGALSRAIPLLEQLVDRESERPQPLRTLALLLMDRAEQNRVAGRTDAAKEDLARAIQLLADAVLKVRREQPRGFATVALMDANLAVQRFRALGGRDHALPQALVAMLDTDIRVVVDWNTPRTDIDLWVANPTGERVGYSHTLGSDGGKLSGDVTNGYGPEEYLIRRAGNGTYTIELDTFAADRTNPNGPSTAQVRLIRNFGRPNQSEERVDVEMDPSDDGMRLVGRIVIR